MKRTLIVILAVLVALLFVACDPDAGHRAFTEVLESSGSFVLDGTPYDTLQEAVSAADAVGKGAEEFRTIKVTRDVTGRGATFSGESKVILDLDGHTLKFADVNEAALILGTGTKVVIQNGTLTFLDKGGSASDIVMIKGENISSLALLDVTIKSNGHDIDVKGEDGSFLYLDGVFEGDIIASGIGMGESGKFSGSVVQIDGGKFYISGPMEAEKLIVGAEQTFVTSSVTVGLLELDAIDNNVEFIIGDKGHLTINDDYMKVESIDKSVSVICAGSKHSSITNNTDKEIDVKGNTPLYLEVDGGNKTYFGKLQDAVNSLGNRTYKNAKITYIGNAEGDAAEGSVDILYPVVINLNGRIVETSLNVGVEIFVIFGDDKDNSCLKGDILMGGMNAETLTIKDLTVTGNVSAKGTVDVLRSEIKGRVIAEGDIRMSATTIKGDLVDSDYGSITITNSSVGFANPVSILASDILIEKSILDINEINAPESVGDPAEVIEITGSEGTIITVGKTSGSTVICAAEGNKTIEIGSDIVSDGIIKLNGTVIGSDTTPVKVNAPVVEIVSSELNVTQLGDEYCEAILIEDPRINSEVEFLSTDGLMVKASDDNLSVKEAWVFKETEINGGHYVDFHLEGNGQSKIKDGLFGPGFTNISSSFTYSGDGSLVISGGVFLGHTLLKSGTGRIDGLCDVNASSDLPLYFSDLSINSNGWSIKSAHIRVTDVDQLNNIAAHISQDSTALNKYTYIAYDSQSIGDSVLVRPASAKQVVLSFIDDPVVAGDLNMDIDSVVTLKGKIHLNGHNFKVTSERNPLNVVYSDTGKLMEGAKKGNQYVYAYPVVTFYKNGGIGDMEKQIVGYDEATNLSANTFTRAGYDFIGWAYKDDATEVDYQDAKPITTKADVSLYAVWKLKETLKVTFSANYGSQPATHVQVNQLYYTGIVLDANEFTREGYTFTGWNTKADGTGTPYANRTIVTLSDDLYLYAQWVANKYVVRFDNNYGDGSMAEQVLTYDVQSRLSANSFTRPGYSLKEWNTKSDGTGISYSNGALVENLVPSGVKILYAIWTPNTYLVKVDDGLSTTGSEVVAQYQTKTFDQDLTISTLPTRTGHTLSGLLISGYTGDTPTYTTQKITLKAGTYGNIVLTPIWKVNKYSIAFDSNGGTGAMSPITNVYYDVQQVLPPNTFTRTGYRFIGWSTTQNGAVEFDDNERVIDLSANDGDIVTLYAVWAANTYSVTLNTNGGVINSGNVTSYVYGFGATLPSSLSRPGWTFGGWYDNSSFSGDPVTSISTTQTGNRTYYAKWTLGYVTLLDSKEIIIAKSPMYKDNIGSATAGFPIDDSPAGYVWYVGYGDSTLTDNRVYLPNDTEFVILKQADHEDDYSLCPERSTMQSFGLTALDAVGKAAHKVDLWMWTITIESVDITNKKVKCYRFGHTGGESKTNEWSFGDRPGSNFDYLSISTRGISY